jgi:large subunit ribosomal protein L31e
LEKTADAENSTDAPQITTEKVEQQADQALLTEGSTSEKPKEVVEETPVEETKEEPEKDEEEIEVVEERTYLLPFQKVWRMPRQARAPKAARMLREYVQRHMKVDEVLLSNEVNEQIWAKGITNPPRKLRVRMVKDKEGKVTVYPAKGE